MIPLKDTVPSRRFPIVNTLLIAVNVFVFFVELSQGTNLKQFIYNFGAIPSRYFYLKAHYPHQLLNRFLPIFTSMFLHGGWFHLIGNMLYLWIFGDNVEDRMGHFRYLLFYLLSGIGAGLFHIYTNAHSTVPSIGASGAIAGVLGAYFILFPFSRILTLVPFFFFWTFLEIPAFFFLGFWFLMQFFSGTTALLLAGDKAAGGIAWWAHIGGFITGITLLPFFLWGRKQESYYTVLKR